MAQHAKIDGAGNLLGFYDDRLHATLPAGVVTLTEAQYEQWTAGQRRLVWDSGTSSLVAAPAAATAPVPVPPRISAYQLKAQLLSMPGAEAGKTLLDDVDAWTMAASGIVRLAWTELALFPIDGVLMTAAIAHFGWSSAEVDQMFTAAAAIRA